MYSQTRRAAAATKFSDTRAIALMTRVTLSVTMRFVRIQLVAGREPWMRSFGAITRAWLICMREVTGSAMKSPRRSAVVSARNRPTFAGGEVGEWKRNEQQLPAFRHRPTLCPRNCPTVPPMIQIAQQLNHASRPVLLFRVRRQQSRAPRELTSPAMSSPAHKPNRPGSCCARHVRCATLGIITHSAIGSKLPLGTTEHVSPSR
jgi:hypothetical protein